MFIWLQLRRTTTRCRCSCGGCSGGTLPAAGSHLAVGPAARGTYVMLGRATLPSSPRSVLGPEAATSGFVSRRFPPQSATRGVYINPKASAPSRPCRDGCNSKAGGRVWTQTFHWKTTCASSLPLRREDCRPGQTDCRRTPRARGGFCGLAVGPSTSGRHGSRGRLGRRCASCSRAPSAAAGRRPTVHSWSRSGSASTAILAPTGTRTWLWTSTANSRLSGSTSPAFLEGAKVLGAPLGVFLRIGLQHLSDELLVAGFGVFKLGCSAETHVATSLILAMIEKAGPYL